jgi:hypothetical protein
MTDNEASAPLSVALLTGNGENDKEPKVAVFGNTYDFKLVLAAHGGKWDANRKLWTFPTEEQARAAVADGSRLYTMRAACRGGSA